MLTPKPGVNERFYYYTLLSIKEHLQVLGRGSTFMELSADDLRSIELPLPPLPTQRRIADFLDRETAQIDALIAAKEHMLALLQEKRAAQISQMVTKGLNPDVEMKDSGLAWLGEIPAHWEVRRIKHVAEVGNGSTPSRENLAYWEDGTYPWLNSSVVNQEVVEEASRYVTELALIECHLPRIVPPAVLVGITGQGKTRGSSAILTFEATINQHLAYIKPIKSMDVFYLSQLMDVAYKYLRNESEGNGGTKGAITCEQLANFIILIPPITEQDAIKQSIKLYDQRYAGVESDLNSSISLLRERRGALITAAVTGQLPEVLA